MTVKDAIEAAHEDIIEFYDQFMSEIDNPQETWDVIAVRNHPRSHITEIIIRIP